MAITMCCWLCCGYPDSISSSWTRVEGIQLQLPVKRANHGSFVLEVLTQIYVCLTCVFVCSYVHVCVCVQVCRTKYLSRCTAQTREVFTSCDVLRKVSTTFSITNHPRHPPSWKKKISEEISNGYNLSTLWMDGSSSVKIVIVWPRDGRERIIYFAMLVNCF